MKSFGGLCKGNNNVKKWASAAVVAKDPRPSGHRFASSLVPRENLDRV